MQYVLREHGYSERRACRVIQFNRGSARRPPSKDRDLLLRTRLRELAEERRRFGSPRLHALLRREGLVQNHKRTERIYREEGLSLRTRKRTKRPSHTRVEQVGPTGPDEQWAMDFVSDALMNGRRIRILTIADLWDRSSPALEVDMSLPGLRVVRVLERLRLQGRKPQRIKVDNGPKFSGKALDAWASEHNVEIEFTRPGRPTDNGHIESFNGKFRDECLNQYVFSSVHDARQTVEAWRQDYNQRRPHSSLGWLTPEEFCRQNRTHNPTGTTNLQVVYAMG